MQEGREGKKERMEEGREGGEEGGRCCEDEEHRRGESRSGEV